MGQIRGKLHFYPFLLVQIRGKLHFYPLFGESNYICFTNFVLGQFTPCWWVIPYVEELASLALLFSNETFFGDFSTVYLLTLGSILFSHKCIVNCVGVPFAFEAFGRFFVNLPINVSDGGCTFKLHVAVFGRKMLPLSLEAESKDFSKSQLECGRLFWHQLFCLTSADLYLRNNTGCPRKFGIG